jgi:hypothetical protein
MSYEAERAIAKASTSGPWRWAEYKTDGWNAVIDANDTMIADCDANDGLHIATFNPEFCLGLLDKLERYERALEAIEANTCCDEAEMFAADALATGAIPLFTELQRSGHLLPSSGEIFPLDAIVNGE